MTCTLDEALEAVLAGQPLELDRIDARVRDQLEALGLAVETSSPPRLRRCADSVRLNAGAIRRAGLADGLTVQTLLACASTNDVLRQRFRHRHAVLAEAQTAGRGRCGRRWLSPPGTGLCLSFGYRFAAGMPVPGALSPSVALALAEALSLPELRVKWPNDLVARDLKLAGVLIELRSAGDGIAAIIGVGLNVDLGVCRDRVREATQRGMIDLAALGASCLDRNRIAARLLNALDRICSRWHREAGVGLAERYARLDALAGRVLRVATGQGVLEGRAAGICADGRLRLIDASGSEHRIAAGEVQLDGG